MKMSLRQNMGVLDRFARLCIGIVLVALAVFVATGAMRTVAILLSIPPVLTAIVGICPAYVPFGISTNEKQTCC